MADQASIKAYNQLVAKAWADPTFKERLLAEPEATLRAEGGVIEDGVRIRVLEPNETRAYLLFPEERPADGESDAWTQLCRKALDDPAFKARLVAEPAAVLAEAGVPAPAEAALEVVGADDTEGYLILPSKPEGLDPDSLDDDVAGYFSCAVLIPVIAAAVAPAATQAALPAFVSMSTQMAPTPQPGTLAATHRNLDMRYNPWTRFAMSR